MAMTPDGKTIFAGSHDGVVHVWNSERKLLAKLMPATNAVVLSAVSVDEVGPTKSARLSFSNPKSEIRNPKSTRASLRRLPQIGSVHSLSAQPKELRLTADAVSVAIAQHVSVVRIDHQRRVIEEKLRVRG